MATAAAATPSRLRKKYHTALPGAAMDRVPPKPNRRAGGGEAAISSAEPWDPAMPGQHPGSSSRLHIPP